MGKAPIAITKLVLQARLGDKKAGNQLFEEIYPVLKKIARSQIRKGANRASLNTTDVVHEVYIRFFHQAEDVQPKDRLHFYAMMATAVRWYLMETARNNKSQKRGENAIHISLDSLGIGSDDSPVDMIALDKMLNKLGEKNERLLQIVQLRVFCGMSIEEAAEMMGISPTTAKRNWKLATAWLAEYLGRTDNEAA